MQTPLPRPGLCRVPGFAWKPTTVTLGLSFSMALFAATEVHADGYWRSVANNALTVVSSARKELTVDQEVDRINAQWDKWRAQRKTAGVTTAPQGVMFANLAPNTPIYPLYRYHVGDPAPVSVDFSFVDPDTGFLTAPGFTPAEVRYQMLESPGDFDPTAFDGLDEAGIEALIRPLLLDIGASTNAADNFRIDFNLSGFEPIFFAFAYDDAGNEIRGDASAAWISTVQVPEPSTWTIMILGFGLTGAALRRRRIRPA